MSKTASFTCREQPLRQRKGQEPHASAQTTRAEQEIQEITMVFPDKIAGVMNGRCVASSGQWPKTLEAAENVRVKRTGKKLGIRFNGLIETDARSPRPRFLFRSIHIIDRRHKLGSEGIGLLHVHHGDPSPPSHPISVCTDSSQSMMLLPWSQCN